jgi:NTP pyrophosphatase (non-canonical NTP hydrolase)
LPEFPTETQGDLTVLRIIRDHLAWLWFRFSAAVPFVWRGAHNSAIASLRDSHGKTLVLWQNCWKSRINNLERDILAANVELERREAVHKGQLAEAQRRLPKLETQLASWHARRFGRADVNLPATLAKAVEEMGELSRAMLSANKANAREEAADVAIVLVHLVRGLGGSLCDEMQKKAWVIEKRLTGEKK